MRFISLSLLFLTSCSALSDAVQADPELPEKTTQLFGNVVRVVTGDPSAIVPLATDIGVLVAALFGYKKGVKPLVAKIKNGS